MADKITIGIECMKIFAYHGVGEEERRAGTWFEVECRFVYPAHKAMERDELTATLNYATVADVIRREMSEPSCLIEHVAGRIKNALMSEFQSIEEGRLKISKINPAGCGQMIASVTLEW